MCRSEGIILGGSGGSTVVLKVESLEMQSWEPTLDLWNLESLVLCLTKPSRYLLVLASAHVSAPGGEEERAPNGQ